MDESEAVVEPVLGANCPHRLRMISIFIKRVFHNTMTYHYDMGTGGRLAQPGKQPWLQETLSVDPLRKSLTLDDS
jgi:hypothetical protein